MVCSGSEANDLALRIARANAPGHHHIAIVGGAYHGHTTACIDLSPYKYEGPGGEGKADYVHVLPCPDVYRCAQTVLRTPLGFAKQGVLHLKQRKEEDQFRRKELSNATCDLGTLSDAVRSGLAGE